MTSTRKKRECQKRTQFFRKLKKDKSLKVGKYLPRESKKSFKAMAKRLKNELKKTPPFN